MSKGKFIMLALVVTLLVALGTTGFGITYLQQNTAAVATGLDRQVSRDIDGNTTTSGNSDPLLRTLQNLNNITLDPGIFSRSDFLSLVDFSLQLVEQPRGRNNPFAPLTPGETFSRNSPIPPNATTSTGTPPAFQVDF